MHAVPSSMHGAPASLILYKIKCGELVLREGYQSHGPRKAPPTPVEKTRP